MRKSTASDPMLPIGTNRCRCSDCGEYFGGVGAFDLHRKKYACVPPAAVANKKNQPLLRKNERGYWVRIY